MVSVASRSEYYSTVEMWRRWNSNLEFGWAVHADLNVLRVCIVFISIKLVFIEGEMNIADHCL